MMRNWLVAVGMMLAFIQMPVSLAAGDAFQGKVKSAAMSCNDCHGDDGNSGEAIFPKLAGQGEAYLVKQLREFKSGARPSDFMAAIAADLTEEDMADLSAFYAANTSTPGAVSEALLEAGKKVYQAGNKKTGVPACMACHGPRGTGYPAAVWPALSGQNIYYVELQLQAFADGKRKNDPNEMMQDIAARLSKDELKAVSAYVSGLH